MDKSASWGRRGAKVGHRKSRTGCRKCKARRVKCDETHPVCRSCDRLGLDCTWSDSLYKPTPSPGPTSQSSRSLDSEDGASSRDSTRLNKVERPPDRLAQQAGGQDIVPFLIDDEHNGIPESRQRRMLEHRLMLNYMDTLTRPFAISSNSEWYQLFSRVVPSLALKYDNLLYALLTISASNLLISEPDNKELFSARQSYLILATREQRKMVERLSSETADPVCFTSLLLLLNSLNALGERSLEPYVPPLEWLHLGRGAGTVIWMSVRAAKNSPEFEKSNMYIISEAHPKFGEDDLFYCPSLRKDFEGILTQAIPCGEVWDDETKDAYEKTLSVIGSVQNAINKGEPTYAICRRIQAFPLLTPTKFVTFLEERRPRALVVLAHFFATVVQVHDVWWLREEDGGRESTAKREILAISKVLPPEWLAQLVWPLDMVGLSSRNKAL